MSNITSEDRVVVVPVVDEKERVHVSRLKGHLTNTIEQAISVTSKSSELNPNIAEIFDKHSSC